jgi:hypothetical protein
MKEVSSMIEKELSKVELIVFEEDEMDVQEEIEDLKAYAKTYELDQVEVAKQVREELDDERVKFTVTLVISRDTENLGRKYETEEQKIFGFED